MTKCNWQPDDWVDLIIGSFPPFKWEGIQPNEVATRMPELLQRLSDLSTGNRSRSRRGLLRNRTPQSPSERQPEQQLEQQPEQQLEQQPEQQSERRDNKKTRLSLFRKFFGTFKK